MYMFSSMPSMQSRFPYRLAPYSYIAHLYAQAPVTLHCSLQLPRLVVHLVRLNLVVHPVVLEALDRETALVALANLDGILLALLERLECAYAYVSNGSKG